MDIVNNNKPIMIIGASMIDIIGRSFEPIINHDSNPGIVNISAGGVCRNIAENLARLDIPLNLITTVGNDSLSKIIDDSCCAVGIDTQHFFRLDDHFSNSYLAILDNQGDLECALSDTSTLDKLSIEFLKTKDDLIKQSETLIIDASLHMGVVEYLINKYPHHKIYLDPVSVGKSKHIKSLVGKMHMLKCNVLEAQFLSDKLIENNEDFYHVANIFHKLGLEKVIITRGPEGLFYSIKENQGFYKHRQVSVVNATGAGDAFLAGWIYSEYHDLSLDQSIRFASEMSAYSLESYLTVSPHINAQKIMEEIKNEF